MGCINSKTVEGRRRFSLSRFGNKPIPNKKSVEMVPQYLSNRSIFSYDLNDEINNMKDLHDFPYEGEDKII